MSVLRTSFKLIFFFGIPTLLGVATVAADLVKGGGDILCLVCCVSASDPFPSNTSSLTENLEIEEAPLELSEEAPVEEEKKSE